MTGQQRMHGLDSTLTLDEITHRHPETIAVFNHFGIDICCGGGVTLVDAAERDGVALAVLHNALRDALQGAGAGR